MKWRDRRQSGNVDDQRRSGGGRSLGVKGGIGTVVLALVLWGVFGIDPRTTMGVTQQLNSGGDNSGTAVVDTEESARTKQFVQVVLADTEDTWQKIFSQSNTTYTAPTLVLFQNSVQSACGQAQSAVGPFYCPADQKVYLDMQFFTDMRQQLGISGEQAGSGESSSNQAGDFAQAYVIAHEVGHHVQTLIGISQQVNQARQASRSEAESNQLLVRQELQADCFAGLWAHHTQQRTPFMQEGDLQEAMNAASQIGDDRLQQRSQGQIVPESFTHGSSEQRMRWFKTGLDSGQFNRCDTFKQAI